MHKNRPRISFDFTQETSCKTRPCDVPGCTGEGLHRAPKARDRLNDYFWFCLDHVREYNKAWDYYAGMSETEIERHLRQDATWQRPTWPMGFWRVQENKIRESVFRDFGLGDDAGDGERARTETRARMRTPEEDALILLDLDPPVDFARIKARYKELVKLHHPDANGGDKAAEEKLKLINQAYTTLKACYGA